jgi:AcrR family transcriptional regulator
MSIFSVCDVLIGQCYDWLWSGHFGGGNSGKGNEKMVKTQAASDGEGSKGGTKERIFKVAAELFATRGFHATGMADLEKATGLGRGALYYHISSKEELLFEITSRYLHVLLSAGEGLLATPMSAEARFRAYSGVVMAAVVDHLSELTVCFREIHSVVGERQLELLELHRRYERIWTDILKIGVAEGMFHTADSLAVKAVLGMHHYSYLWIRPGGRRTPEEIANFFCELTLSGLRADRPLA